MRRIVRNLLVWLADGTSESGLGFAGRRAFYHEGETIRLTGSAEEKYAKWRQILRQMYARETGLIKDEALPEQPTDSIAP